MRFRKENGKILADSLFSYQNTGKKTEKLQQTADSGKKTDQLQPPGGHGSLQHGPLHHHHPPTLWSCQISRMHPLPGAMEDHILYK